MKGRANKTSPTWSFACQNNIIFFFEFMPSSKEELDGLMDAKAFLSPSPSSFLSLLHPLAPPAVQSAVLAVLAADGFALIG
jgi:hypothetical protein